MSFTPARASNAFVSAVMIFGVVRGLGAAPRSVRETVDACSLLSKSVIESVQGEPTKETKASRAKSGGVLTSQCFYSLPSFTNSISLALTLPDPANSSRTGPRDVWRKMFHETEKNEKEEEAAQPAAISGLGDEAYWVHSFVGTLYVLKGNAYLRLSIGGKQDDAARLRKARILAKDALIRMP